MCHADLLLFQRALPLYSHVVLEPNPTCIKNTTNPIIINILTIIALVLWNSKLSKYKRSFNSAFSCAVCPTKILAGAFVSTKYCVIACESVKWKPLSSKKGTVFNGFLRTNAASKCSFKYVRHNFNCKNESKKKNSHKTYVLRDKTHATKYSIHNMDWPWHPDANFWWLEVLLVMVVLYV